MKAPVSPDTQPSPVATLTDLKSKGYERDFRATEGARVVCDEANIDVAAKELTIDEVFRFEGASDPGDSSIVLAVQAKGEKGALMLGYGPTASPQDADVLEHLDL